jgi:hypothetical protein
MAARLGSNGPGHVTQSLHSLRERRLVGLPGHIQLGHFNSLLKSGDQKAALKPLSFFTRSHDRLEVACSEVTLPTSRSSGEKIR